MGRLRLLSAGCVRWRLLCGATLLHEQRNAVERRPLNWLAVVLLGSIAIVSCALATWLFRRRTDR